MVFLIGMIGLTWGHTETVSIHKQTEVSNKADIFFVGDVMTDNVINYDCAVLDSSIEMNLCQNVNHHIYYNFSYQFGFNVDCALNNLSLESVWNINTDYCQLMFTEKTIRYKYNSFGSNNNCKYINNQPIVKQI